MEDRLKEYVDSHREELELYEPREDVWNGVNERLQHGRRSVMWRRLAIAASVLLVVTSGAWFFQADRSKTGMAAGSLPAAPPITKTEVYFTSIIQMKDAELKQYCTPQPELCREFEQDIAALNNAYTQLKKEYSVSADKERILRAMAANLQMQVQLISRQLEINGDGEAKKK